jgi:tetratricopeptide (TPR) repeat protein
MRRRSLLAWLAFVSLVPAAPRPAGAETWYEAYAAGQKALAKGDLAAAEAKLKEAARQGPQPGRQVRAYGVRFITFLPQYDLAKLYARQERYLDALAQIQSLESAGALKPSDAEYRELAQLRELATTRLASASRPSAVAAATPPPPTLPPPPTPEPGQSVLQETAPSAIPVRPASSSPTTTLPTTGPSRADSDRLLQDARTAAAVERWSDARRALDAARQTQLDAASVGRISRELEAAEWLAIARQHIATQDWQRADEALRRVARADPANESAKGLRAAVEAGLTQLSGSALERAALRSFYQGRYEQAEQLLRRVATVSPSARVHLYLGFSRVALALVSGATDGPLVETARADFDRARRLSPDVHVDRKYVSPRVLALLETPDRSPRTESNR